MKVTLGKEGLEKTWQGKFPEETECVHCKRMVKRVVAYPIRLK